MYHTESHSYTTCEASGCCDHLHAQPFSPGATLRDAARGRRTLSAGCGVPTTCAALPSAIRPAAGARGADTGGEGIAPSPRAGLHTQDNKSAKNVRKEFRELRASEGLRLGRLLLGVGRLRLR
eukprot:COSAG04_NODE_2311_length_4348_cov_2.486703_9_plen_122_part_01